MSQNNLSIYASPGWLRISQGDFVPVDHEPGKVVAKVYLFIFSIPIGLSAFSENNLSLCG